MSIIVDKISYVYKQEQALKDELWTMCRAINDGEFVGLIGHTF